MPSGLNIQHESGRVNHPHRAARARRLGLSEGRVAVPAHVVLIDEDLPPYTGREVEVWHRGRSGVPHAGRRRDCLVCRR